MKAIVIRLLAGIVIAGALLFVRGERPVVPSASHAAETRPVGYANPAAVYCGSLGYAYETRHTPAGDVGICKLPDSSTCEAWDFLNGKCGAKFSFCGQQGYGTERKSDGNSPYSRDYAVCTDAAGREVGTVVQLAQLEEKSEKTGCSEQAPVTVDEEATPPELFTTSVPASFDWRTRPKGNYLTNVRDQGQCGSCWAFAAVGVTEAALNIANDKVGNAYDLAEEYLVSSCSRAGTCCGGYPSQAISQIKSSGVPDESCMPYVDGASQSGTNLGCQCTESGTCSSTCAYRTGGQCSDKTCSNRCSNYATRLKKLNTTGYVSGRAAIKSALVTKGPLTTSIWMGGHF